MSRSMIFVFAVVAVLCVVVESKECCPPKEVWQECGTACPPTCENPNPQICTLQCVTGCQCLPGLLRNKDGECVPLWKC